MHCFIIVALLYVILTVPYASESAFYTHSHINIKFISRAIEFEIE